MTPARGLAPAKVNLCLHVTGRRADGRHELDSLVCFADLGDVLDVSEGDGLSVTGPFAEGVPEGDANLVRRALAAAGMTRSVVLDKRLPHPAGIGGGSSDAACALRLAGATLPVETLMTLGADLPVCIAARASRMRGAGEAVEPVTLPATHAVLANPGVGVPTGAAFGALERRENDGLGSIPELTDAGQTIRYLMERTRNDLELPAIGIAPAIAEVLGALRGAGAGLARMSGSGATCFGLWETRAAAESAAARLARPGWWVRPATLW